MVGGAFDERSERAQLILVGAVAIAFIVLGLAVVFNTVLYTENVASTGASEAPRDAQKMNRELNHSTKHLIADVNRDGNWTSESRALEGARDHTRWYAANLTRVTGQSSGAIVNLSVIDTGNGGYHKMGAVIHSTGSHFESRTGAENWSVVESPAPPFGDFTMTVERSSLAAHDSDEKFRMVWNASNTNDNYTVWVYKASSGNVAVQTVNDSSKPAHDFTVGGGCELQDTTALDTTVDFDFEDGFIHGHPECSGQINVSAGVPSEATRTLSFHRGGSAKGQYSLAVNDETVVGEVTNPLSLSLPISPSQSPYWTYGVWVIEMEVKYDSASASFVETYPIEVYNRSR